MKFNQNYRNMRKNSKAKQRIRKTKNSLNLENFRNLPTYWKFYQHSLYSITFDSNENTSSEIKNRKTKF